MVGGLSDAVICPSVRLSHAHSSTMGLCLLQNTNRKSKPLVSMVEVAKTAAKPLLALFQKHVPGGCTIDMPQLIGHWWGALHTMSMWDTLSKKQRYGNTVHVKYAYLYMLYAYRKRTSEDYWKGVRTLIKCKMNSSKHRYVLNAIHLSPWLKIPQHFSKVLDRCRGVLRDVVERIMNLDQAAADHAVQHTCKLDNTTVT